MLLHILAIPGVLALKLSAKAETTQSLYGQCGGISYTGPTKCPKTAICYNDGTNPWYSQCVLTPWDNGGGQPTTTTTTSKSTTTTTTTTKPTTTTTTTPPVITIITTLPPPTTKPGGGKPTTITLVPDDPFTEARVQRGPVSESIHAADA